MILKLKPKLKDDANFRLFQEIAIESDLKFNEAECAIESTDPIIDVPIIEVERKLYFKHCGENWESWRNFPKQIESDVTEEGESYVEKGIFKVDVQPTRLENSWIFSIQTVMTQDGKCPHCGHEEIECHMNGESGPAIPDFKTMTGLYKCKNCGKYFQGPKGLNK